MADFSLGYELNGEHHGLGVSLGSPPDSFSVREHHSDGSYTESRYVLERHYRQLEFDLALAECARYEAINHYQYVGQVAKEMLQCLVRFEEYGTCDSLSGTSIDGCEHICDREYCWPSFEERLKALGVVIDG